MVLVGSKDGTRVWLVSYFCFGLLLGLALGLC